MKTAMRRCGRIVAGLLVVGIVAGCASDGAMLMPKPPANARKLGRVEGRAAGSVLLGLIPIKENSRTMRAYNRALAQAPGATALTDVTLQENWYTYGLGTLNVVTVSGEAVK